MTAQTWTLSGSGGFSDLAHSGSLQTLRAYVVSSEQVVTDTTTGGTTRLGTKQIAFAQDGSWSVSGLPATGDANWMPEVAAYQVVVEYRDDVPGSVTETWTSNYFTLTADVDFKDVVAVTPTAVTPAMVADFAAAIAAITGKLTATSNLSDVASASTALVNLGAAAQMTLRAVTANTTAADAEFIEVDATTAIRTVTGPAAGAKRWGVRKANGTDTAPGNKVVVSYFNSAGTTATIDLTLAKESKVFRPNGLGYSVETGHTPARAVVAGLEFNLLDGPQAVDPSGVTDSAVAVQAALTAAAAVVTGTRPNAATTGTKDVARAFNFPSATLKLNSSITHPAGLDLKGPVGGGAILRAGASMTTMIDTLVGSQHQHEQIHNLTLDCNGQAGGMYQRYFTFLDVEGLTVLSPVGFGVKYGDSGAAGNSYGLRQMGLKVNRDRALSIPAGSIAAWMGNVTDSTVLIGDLVSCDYGMRIDGSSNDIFGVRAYNPQAFTGMTACFDDYATGTEYSTCQADSPSVDGWRLNGYWTRINGGRAFGNGSTFPDNTATAVHVTTTNGAYHFFNHLLVRTGSSSRRWKADYATDDTTYKLQRLNALTASDSSTIVTRAFGSRSHLNGLFVEGAAGAAPMQIKSPGDADAFQVYDSGSVKRFAVQKAGLPGLPTYATTGRPTASSAGAGYCYFDTTLNKPAWSDGTNYRDAAGTTV